MTQPYGPPQKKRMSGCVVAIIVILGSAAVGLTLAGYGVYRVTSTPTGKRAVKVVGDTASIMFTATDAPGAKEVRDKGDCDEALVVTPDAMAKLERDLSDAAPVERALVMCQVSFFRTPPSCEVLAETYVTAVHPSWSFVVQVKKQGSRGFVCETTFDASGARSAGGGR